MEFAADMTRLAETVARSWWLFALRGVAAIVFGVLVIAWPGIGLAVLIALFGAYALVHGALTIGTAIARRKEGRHWGAQLVGGVLGLIVGVLTFIMPGITALSLLLLVAAWAIVTGVAEIVAAVHLREVIENEWLLGLDGLLGIALGVVLFAMNPAAGILALVLWVAIYAIVAGVVTLALGFRLRGFAKEARLETHPAT
jgi:uncharacterized membrane protein HdeD (DUF308 family)